MTNSCNSFDEWKRLGVEGEDISRRLLLLERPTSDLHFLIYTSFRMTVHVSSMSYGNKKKERELENIVCDHTTSLTLTF